jgi:rfaE bifunctional protein kinase chain/domain
VIASNHHIVRIDQEDVHDISNAIEDAFYTLLLPYIRKSDIVILSDYNKGLLTQSLSLKIIEVCNEQQKKVIVDPKGLDYTKYKGSFIIKPNRKELAEAAKTDKIHSQGDLESAAKVIFGVTDTAYLIVTLSENGIAIITPGHCKIIPVAANEVYDVTGAGDTVIATLAYCVGLGFSIEEACTIANYAASIVIKHIGSATTTIDEILTALK